MQRHATQWQSVLKIARAGVLTPLTSSAGRLFAAVNSVAQAILHGCLTIREHTGLCTVALSGGVFQNMLLLQEIVRRLEGHGFGVLVHSRVPCNDGGISLGQAVVAAARDRAGTA